ncbi:MAG: Autoinducer 1 sensor kinase/phosphatase LuxN [Candidatus Celerinatantimonas neptuna]|nr:MAG: Autoinducer 1 sensor kinase/phosphatase LuxN [Candidatus Celerinatantimonas neptuna]
MIELYQFINPTIYPRGCILAVTAIFSSIWFIYFIFHSIKENILILKILYYPYIIYSFFVILWILSNMYFQTKFVEYFNPNVATGIAKAANIFSYISYSSIYHFTCRLLSDKKNHSIKKWQFYFLWILSIYCIYTNIFTTNIILDVKVISASNFTIYFGSQAPIFFTIISALTLGSLINLISLFQSKNKLIKLKSTYMLIGMLVFMISTLLFSVLLTYYSNSFSYTWLPPAFSIFEVLFMGYASIAHRFYSWRYISYLTTNSLITLMGFIFPIMLLSIDIQQESHVTILLTWTLIYGLAWKNIWKFIGQYISIIIYGHKITPVSEIYKLSKDFQISIEQATRKLSELLQIDPKSILITDAKTHKLYSSYLVKSDPVLLIEEIEYHATTSANPHLLVIHNQMSEHNSAMILPMYDDEHLITRLFITPHKSDGSIYSNEEISALQNLLKNAQNYIYNEFHVKQSQAIAHSIAHEMRNPLSQLQLHLEKITELFYDKRDQSYIVNNEICQAKNAIYQTNYIIDAMLQGVQEPRIQPGSIAPFSIYELIKKTINDYPFSSNKNLERVIVNNQGDFTVKVQPIFFGFILFNLFRNSIYYFDEYPNSIIEITIKPGNTYNQVFFKDFGPGINPLIQHQIFDDFFTYQKSYGTGLGLSYCRRVMKLFGGQIKCQSIYGESTTFILYFPIVKQLEKVFSRNSEQKELLQKPYFSELCVLVADDSNSQRLLICLYLKQLGIHVIEATNGEDALEKLKKNQFNLVFMDIQMPIMDGITTTRIIKKLYPKLPVIALSGESAQKEINELMDDRLLKPVSKEQLVKMIKKWLYTLPQEK